MKTLLQAKVFVLLLCTTLYLSITDAFPHTPVLVSEQPFDLYGLLAKDLLYSYGRSYPRLYRRQPGDELEPMVPQPKTYVGGDGNTYDQFPSYTGSGTTTASPQQYDEFMKQQAQRINNDFNNAPSSQKKDPSKPDEADPTPPMTEGIIAKNGDHAEKSQPRPKDENKPNLGPKMNQVLNDIKQEKLSTLPEYQQAKDKTIQDNLNLKAAQEAQAQAIKNANLEHKDADKNEKKKLVDKDPAVKAAKEQVLAAKKAQKTAQSNMGQIEKSCGHSNNEKCPFLQVASDMMEKGTDLNGAKVYPYGTRPGEASGSEMGPQDPCEGRGNGHGCKQVADRLGVENGHKCKRGRVIASFGFKSNHHKQTARHANIPQNRLRKAVIRPSQQAQQRATP